MARAIKIDPKTKTIEQIEIKSPDEIRTAIGGWFAVLRMPRRGEYIYFDEEGGCKDGLAAFKIADVVLVGPAVVMCDKMRGAKSSIADVAAMVRFAA